MKTKDAPKDLTLIQLFDRFGTEAKARKHLEGILWPKGIVCPHCETNDQAKFSTIAANPAKKVRAGLRWCSNCEKQFTVTIGTIFEDSHIPLRKWLIAWYLLCSSKKGISSLQLQRLLELGSYRTALFMTHRIRHALKDSGYAEKLEGTIEADEAVLGGYMKGGKTGFTAPNKTPIVAMVQRGGSVRTKIMPTVNGANLRQAIRDNVKAGATLHTDSQRAYSPLGSEYQHSIVNHAAGEYTRRDGENVVTRPT